MKRGLVFAKVLCFLLLGCAKEAREEGMDKGNTIDATPSVLRGKIVGVSGEPLEDVAVYVEEGGREVVTYTSETGEFVVPIQNDVKWVYVHREGFVRLMVSVRELENFENRKEILLPGSCVARLCCEFSGQEILGGGVSVCHPLGPKSRYLLESEPNSGLYSDTIFLDETSCAVIHGLPEGIESQVLWHDVTRTSFRVGRAKFAEGDWVSVSLSKVSER